MLLLAAAALPIAPAARCCC